MSLLISEILLRRIVHSFKKFGQHRKKLISISEPQLQTGLVVSRKLGLNVGVTHLIRTQNFPKN